MPKVRMKDMVILLPGITGSVLQKDGSDIWAVSGQAVWKALSSFGASLENLVLRGDDPSVDDLGDGITASRVMPDVHIVPGLVKIDGYSATSRMITEQFDVIRGSLHSDKPANFFEFPYDWRRDNRQSARRLHALIQDHLPRWRRYSGAAQAKVILLAHSMGGLVSRYYLEVLEGWRDCKALVTFGTPYRGSVNALDFLANGYKKLFIDLTEAMRSFTSVYQLLPIYRVLNSDGNLLRVAEADCIPNLDNRKAREALAFHREIEDAVNRHLEEAEYQDAGYKIVPVVGTRQPTLLSATLSGNCLATSRDLPAGIDELLSDGDGTVPYVSAIPIELSDEYRESYVPERHGSLQKQPQVLNDLYNRLRQMQIQGLAAIRGAAVTPQMAERPAISLDLEDVYLQGEPLQFGARLVNTDPASAPPKARVQPVAGGPVIDSDFAEHDDGFMLQLDGLAPGLYRIEVRQTVSGPQAAPPVHDVFEVSG
jgi:pimeloyl-ACP methyl ester carboxylesterase